MILGIDSATAEASVALADNGVILGEERGATDRCIPEGGKQPSQHAETLLPLIAKLFARHAVTVEQLAGISVSIGPGSFTGLRIGIATAKGLAYGSGVPVVGVSTLLANARRASGCGALIGSVLDARKGEVYCAIFRSESAGLSRLTEDALMSVDALIELCRTFSAEFNSAFALIGDGAQVHEEMFIDALKPARVFNPALLPTLAGEIARLGSEQIGRSSVRDCGALVPVYLRSTAAELKVKRALNG